MILDAVETSRKLTELGVPHALVGGLAVGLHGHPRATKDVDFLVGAEAFDTIQPILTYRKELASVVKMGEVDLLAVPPGRRVLETGLMIPRSGELPVVGMAELILMKLDAGRPQDTADIHHLLDGRASVDEVGQFLSTHAPDVVDKFARLLDERDAENKLEQ